MGDYTEMSAYYDIIMTSGYYNYQSIVDGLLHHDSFESILEIGCGTGLILEEIIKRQPNTKIYGIDLTQSMLDIAQKRLAKYPNIKLFRQNITELTLDQQCSMAFSYGGVWYFVNDDYQEPFLVSHIYDDQENHLGLKRLSKFIQSNGKLLLGIQGPHHDYEKYISNGMVYSQKIEPLEFGFTKHYYLYSHGKRIMNQTIRYRTYNFFEAKQLFKSYGFEYQGRQAGCENFIEFIRM